MWRTHTLVIISLILLLAVVYLIFSLYPTQ